MSNKTYGMKLQKIITVASYIIFFLDFNNSFLYIMKPKVAEKTQLTQPNPITIGKIVKRQLSS